MIWIDWIIVCIPLIVVILIGFKSQKYIKGVSDFLTAGRIAGRYVVCVASGEAGIGLISLVAIYEAMYNSGFAYGFWNQLILPISMIMGLTGYCAYRFRETRAMTMGQFLEIRYNRKFRILAAFLQTISGVLNYALFPAVGARFLIYFCDFPLHISIGSWMVPTFALLMAFFLALAVFVACMGGMVTDCVQGLLSYPMYAIIVFYIIWRFSWFHEMAPTLLDRPPGKSMLNPFDISKLRDFNLFYVAVGIFSTILGRMSWSGSQGYNTAARSAHEQKMGGVLGTWRLGFSQMMYVLLAVVAFTYLNNKMFQAGDSGAHACRTALAKKVFDDIAPGKEFDKLREEYREYLATGKLAPDLQKRLDSLHTSAKDVKTTNTISASKGKPIDKEAMLTVGRKALLTVSPKQAQVFGTIFGQMRVPMAIKYILPAGLLGIFCALCIFLMISTDTTYLHSWGSIIVQDIILPLRGEKPFTPIQQIRLLRILIACVAAFAFFFSLFFGQVDFILMFFAITGAIWTGGAGVVIVGGLYWKRGTTAAAFASLLIGSGIATTGAICQNIWAGTLYPLLEKSGNLVVFSRYLEMASAPFEPYIMWRVTPIKFPINSQELLFFSMISSITIYVVVSLLSGKGKNFNMDRMLHRGKYQLEGRNIDHGIKGIRDFFRKVIGINDEYTRGDKVIAWSVFIWSFGLQFMCFFVIVAVWNMFRPWSMKWWANYFFVQQLLLGGIVAVISTVWFTWGGTRDLFRLFRDLEHKKVNINDDGRVIDHVSADDIQMVEKVDHIHIADEE